MPFKALGRCKITKETNIPDYILMRKTHNKWEKLGIFMVVKGFPGSSACKESACNAGDPSSIPGLGRSPREGLGYPLQDSWASLVAQMVKNPPSMRETWVWSLGWKDPLEDRGNPLQYSCLNNSHGQRSLVGYSPWGHKESNTTEMTNHSTAHDS